MDTLFTPKADDKLAPAISLVEVATVKPSGYLQGRGIVLPEQKDTLVAMIRNYYEQQDRPEPVIVTRASGTAEWTVLDAPQVNIPDTLPDDFK